MPFAVTWMDVEIVTLNKTKKQISYDTTYKWNLKKKNGTNELLYKIETNFGLLILRGKLQWPDQLASSHTDCCWRACTHFQ